MEEETIKICLKEIVIKDLNDVHYQFEIEKIIGNLLFVNAQSIEVSDVARQLHKGDEAFVSDNELKEITVILSSNPYFVPWVHSQIIQYFTDKIPELTGAE